MSQNYTEFLNRKRKTVIKSGFIPDALPDCLFEFQKFSVKRALEYGKYAIFSGTGSGKSRMAIVFSDQVSKKTGMPVLILTNLAISGQFIREGDKIGIAIKKLKEFLIDKTANGIFVCNYEQLDNISEYVHLFSGVVCDESSILANHEGKTKNKLVDIFSATPYKLCASATPSPNDPMEIGSHAEFLDVMTRAEMLSMFFIHDGGETSKWRLKGHAENRFYEWLATWCVMFNNPGDIGFDNTGYDLPPLNIYEERIDTPAKDGMLFNIGSVSATDYNSELRRTCDLRMQKTVEIVNGRKDENFIIWIKHNIEGEILRKLIPHAIEVKGSDDPDTKEKNLLGFAENKFSILITKTKIASMGLNYQNCRNEIFASPDFSFKDLYQGIRRVWRYGQKEECNIWILLTDSMQNIKTALDTKHASHEKMLKSIIKYMSKDENQKPILSGGFCPEVKNSKFQIYNGDCVDVIKKIPNESIGFSIFSPPFASLYTYSDRLEDMGNCTDYNLFVEQFNFLVEELFRVLKPGRNIAVHCMDLPIQKGKEGFIGLRDFSGTILNSFINNGFIYHSRVTIWKNPVTEMQRTKALGLLHKQIKKDAAMSRVGIPDYLMVFRKSGESVDPVIHQDTDYLKSNYLPVDMWQKIASPVWMDIDYSDTLQYKSAREANDEKHICPLQLETIRRSIQLWSNEGDNVLSPFAGIGSEIWQSVKMDRFGIGIELKPSYYNQMKKNLLELVDTPKPISLF